jgi:hypothetical protein
MRMEAHLRLSRSNQFKGEDGMKRVTGKKTIACGYYVMHPGGHTGVSKRKVG